MEAEAEEDGNGLRSNTLSTTFQCFPVAHPVSHSCVEEERYLCVLNSIGDPFHVKGGGESEIRGGGERSPRVEWNICMKVIRRKEKLP